MNAPSPDADLADLRAWQSGDNTAGKAFVARHFPGIFRFFSAKIPAHAEDLTQITFMAALKGAASFRAEGSVRAWLFGIARLRLLSHLRDTGRERDRPLADEALGEHSIADLVGLTPSVAVDQHRERALLLAAMRQLPLDMQIVLELHYWEDLRVPEIALIVDAPEGTVKRRLQRGRDRLASEMARLGAQPDLIDSTMGGFATWIDELKGILAAKADD